MPLRYQTTEYYFVQPDIISKTEFEYLKQQLQNSPDFSLVNNIEKITEEFSILFKIFPAAILSGFITYLIVGMELIDYVSGFLQVIFGIIIIALALFTIFGILNFMASLSTLFSFARYLKIKKRYFIRMENSIKKSDSYSQFIDSFY